ncbi:MAG: N-6 DNA methylase [Acidobacteriia bacterium]|nr:N-6 DNA methylase [Terriglobia bacterium]
MARRNQDFQTIRSEGGLLPPDLLRRVLDPRAKLDGTRPEDYGLPQDERLNEVITQSWNRLRKHWTEFRTTTASLPEGEAGTGLTNDKWSLPLLRELGFGLLPTSAGPEVGDRSYAISRFFGPVPVHLVGCGLSLDHRAAGQRGAAAANPHGLVQEFLNRSSGHLWALVSNGLILRVLRDNQALSRQSFLEFNLEAMFEGEVYSDFVLLWLTAHATRFAPRESARPETCWLEQWTKLAEDQGTRALGDLRGGVERALQILGEGFTSHPKNTSLRDALRTSEITPADFHGQLLRVVYRLIFLFVAEDRTLEGQSLLHLHDDSNAAHTARERYAAHYSTARMRELANRIKGSRHADLWRQFQVMVGALSGDAAFTTVREHLALPALGCFLWNPASTAALNDAELTNHDFLEALRDLAFTRQGKVLRPVDYKNLGAEELGGVYESLLALTPQISADGARFSFAEFAGNERKTSGSYYTPDSLVQCLLDSALDPVVEEAIKGKSGAEAEKAILALKVCDPAVGSGHFLVGAAHRLARHLARMRALAQGESEPSPLLYQHAIRDVIGRCLYGVDVNPMAAELCRVSLWLEALEPGKPLSFLDHHIRVGNSLLGATPGLIAAGLPDDAFTPIEGDDKKACSLLRKRNKAERAGLGSLFSQQDAETQAHLQQASAALEELPDDRPDDLRAKELAFRRHEETAEYRHKKQLADAWCAAFVVNRQFPPHCDDPRYPSKEPFGLTHKDLKELAAGRPLPADLVAESERLSGQYQFFHWHLVFPEVFARGGFDCVLGNPPWEMVELSEKEFFAQRAPGIANASSARQRQALILKLENDDPPLWLQFLEAKRRVGGSRHFIQASGRFALSSVGRINLYPLFTESVASHLHPGGRAGIIVPSAISMDAYNAALFGWLLQRSRLVSLFDFENAGELFPSVHRSYRFCLLTLAGDMGFSQGIGFCYFAHSVEELRDPRRRITLSRDDILNFSPNTLAPPIFQCAEDKGIARRCYRRLGVFLDRRDGRLSPWKPSIQRMLSLSDEGDFFRRRDELPQVIPGGFARLYSGKTIHAFNHRYATFVGSDWRSATASELSDATFVPVTEYYARVEEIDSRIAGKFPARWLFGYRDIARATDERTSIAAIVPRTGCDTHCRNVYVEVADPILTTCLMSNMNAFVFDYLARQKIIGTGMGAGALEQLPVIPPNFYPESCSWSGGPPTLRDWLLPRVLELTYTAWDLEPFAQDCGWFGPPFRWDEGRRFLLRCELDAAFFHLYLPVDKSSDWLLAEGETAEDQARLKASFPTPRDAVAYIMDTFPIVRRKDEEKYNGDYRTKSVILEIYDAMQECIRTGQPYQTRLDPPPADPRCCHPPRTMSSVGILAYGSLINDPGIEIGPSIVRRVPTTTPFAVEYAWLSKTRGGAPTVVPYSSGNPVNAEVLVLSDSIRLEEARSMLWRRETRKELSGQLYSERNSVNAVLIRDVPGFCGLDHVLYTDFNPQGELVNPDPLSLARAAISSVPKASPGQDGISYLMSLIQVGVETALTPSYVAEILALTGTTSLAEALDSLRLKQKGETLDGQT